MRDKQIAVGEEAVVKQAQIGATPTNFAKPHLAQETHSKGSAGKRHGNKSKLPELI